jgi:DHA1 family multidrug resistance protein-like MFS transporter
LGETTVSLVLALYVLGYALGPLIAAPLSEIPWVGRNIPYWTSFIPFLIISIVLTQVQEFHFATICVLRFLQGYFGSPILATGAASYDDIFDEFASPYGYMLWLGAMYGGPALGPLLSGYAVVNDFRWPYWEVAIMGAVLVPLVALLPETSADYILLQRAKRMRNLTGDPKYRARTEIKKVRVAQVFTDALMKPMEIAVKDPAIGFVTLYGGIVYATYYSFFEVRWRFCRSSSPVP